MKALSTSEEKQLLIYFTSLLKVFINCVLNKTKGKAYWSL